MKNIFMLLLIFFISQITFASWPGFKGSGGWGRNNQYSKYFYSEKATAVYGVVEEIDLYEPEKGMSKGVYLKLNCDNQHVNIQLGPVWYIERLDIDISVGDKIEAKGVFIPNINNRMMVAAEIKKGDKLIILRDRHGTPVWAAYGGINH